MAQVTITFAEDGQAAVSFQISASVAAKLDQFVTDSAGQYAGKADLFLKHNVSTLLTPIITRYPDADVVAKQQQIAALQAEISSAGVEAIVPVTPALTANQ